MTRRLSAGIVLVGLLVAFAARADTPLTGWDRARDPAAGERYRLHVQIEALLNPPREVPKQLEQVLLERARTLLEEASAATSPEPRLRFDLGIVYEDLDRHEQAIDVLTPALALSPRGPGAEQAWIKLAYAAAKLDRSREERDAYDAFLAISLNEGANDDVLANRAEAEMRLGNLDEAVDGYREVIERVERGTLRRSSDFRTLVLARWGLAVALDRNGDPGAAEAEAWRAAQADPRENIIGDQEAVFFVPKYDRDWYYGLGRAEHAKRETDPRRAVQLWTLVTRTWADYVTQAGPKDRWEPLARAHLAAAETQRVAAVARLDATRRLHQARP